MKKFAWSLQRYLDVVAQREQAVRAEIAAAAGRVLAARRALTQRRDALTATLGRVSHEPAGKRLGDQETVMDCWAFERKAMAELEADLARLESARQEMLARLREIRARREMLERLRDQAHDEYLRQAAAEEQKQHDETSQVAFVRGAASGSAESADCRSISA